MLEQKLPEGRNAAVFAAVFPEPGVLIVVEGQTFRVRTVAWLPKEHHQLGLWALVRLLHVTASQLQQVRSVCMSRAERVLGD